MHQHCAAFDVVALGRVLPVKQFCTVCTLVVFQGRHMGEINRIEGIVGARYGRWCPGAAPYKGCCDHEQQDKRSGQKGVPKHFLHALNRTEHETSR